MRPTPFFVFVCLEKKTAHVEYSKVVAMSKIYFRPYARILAATYSGGSLKVCFFERVIIYRVHFIFGNIHFIHR